MLQHRGIKNGQLLRSLATAIDKMVMRALALPSAVANSGFDPVTGNPSISRLNYNYEARTAQELREDGAAATPQFRGQLKNNLPRTTPKQVIVPQGVPDPRVEANRAQQPRRGRTELPWL